jgi:glycosyltransferase involved in cell wall biosynthesis
MAAGCACVATEVGEIPAVLDQAGVVVPPHDPRALAAAIGDLVADDARRDRLGEAATRRVREGYSVKALRDRLIALYEDLGYSR